MQSWSGIGTQEYFLEILGVSLTKQNFLGGGVFDVVADDFRNSHGPDKRYGQRLSGSDRRGYPFCIF